MSNSSTKQEGNQDGTINPVDKEFYLDMEDPWEGFKPEYGYIDLQSKSKSQDNKGFYWLWPSKEKNAPIYVEYSGASGHSCLIKAFSNRAPLSVGLDHGLDKVKKTYCRQVKNEKPFTDKYNMLYIESPIGSGFSKASQKIQSFDEEYAAQKQIYLWLIKKYPNWIGQQWVFCGDSYSSQIMCKTMKKLHEELGQDFKGIFMMAPILDVEKQTKNWDQYEKLKEDKHFNSCCTKCSYCCFFTKILSCCSCCYSIGEATKKVLRALPVAQKIKKNQVLNQQQKPNQSPIPPTGNQSHITTTGNQPLAQNPQQQIDSLPTVESKGEKEKYLHNFITSKLFAKAIQSEKFINLENSEIEIMEIDLNSNLWFQEFKGTSNIYEELTYLLDLGINVEIVIGTKDYVLTEKKMLEVFENIKFKKKDLFSQKDFMTEETPKGKKDFITEETPKGKKESNTKDSYVSMKQQDNLTFKKHNDVTHDCLNDDPGYFHDEILKFCEKSFVEENVQKPKSTVVTHQYNNSSLRKSNGEPKKIEDLADDSLSTDEKVHGDISNNLRPTSMLQTMATKKPFENTQSNVQERHSKQYNVQERHSKQYNVQESNSKEYERVDSEVDDSASE